MPKDRLDGWSEIAAYLHIDVRTAQRRERESGMPVHRVPGKGLKAPVFALKRELDSWLLKEGVSAGERESEPQAIGSPDLAEPILGRMKRIIQGIELYRRDYILRFTLQRGPRGIRANIGYQCDLFNPIDARQPFVQEMTLDDSDYGHIEQMSLFKNGNQMYRLSRPKPTEKLIGYSVYRARPISLEPALTGVLYKITTSYVINRGENDIWYNHMVMPTIGIRVETSASPDFRITPSYSSPDLVMTGEHLDIAWNRRQ